MRFLQGVADIVHLLIDLDNDNGQDIIAFCHSRISGLTPTSHVDIQKNLSTFTTTAWTRKGG